MQSLLRHSKIQTTLDLYTQGDSDATLSAQGQFLNAVESPDLEWYFPAPQTLVPTRTALAHFLLNESLYYYLMVDPQAQTHKCRYEFYDLGLWLWSTPAFVMAAHNPEAAGMSEVEPTKVEFDGGGLIDSVHSGADGANMQVVKSVNGMKLNEFIVSLIN